MADETDRPSSSHHRCGCNPVLHARVRRCDAGLVEEPAHWTVGGVEVSDKPTAWINISTAPAGAAGTHESLTTVLRYTGANLVEAACVRIPVHRDAVGVDGLIGDPEIRIRTKAAVTALLAAV